MWNETTHAKKMLSTNSLDIDKGAVLREKTSYSCAVKLLVQNVLTVTINCCKLYFVGFIFMVYTNHKNIFSYACFPRYINNQLFLNQCKQQSLVLGTSETWLDSTITDSVVALPGYDIHCRDRNRKGGGVMVYVKHYMCGKRRLDLEDDALWLEIRSVKASF